MEPELREQMTHFPKRPGVYVFRDARGNPLYVGKARSLRTRVSHYLALARLDPPKRELVERAVTADAIVTANEVEALVLEATLIREHAPPYNVRLLDDSSYLYVKIPREGTPTVTLTRRILPDGAWYRGPYPAASAIRATLREARKAFPWCAYPNPGAPHDRPCFAVHLGLCPGICVRRMSVEDYARIIDGLKRFLDGDTRGVLRILRTRMAEASAREEYEHAASLRDRIAAIERATLPQHVSTPRRESVDALGVARRGTHAVVTILSVREGRVVGSRPFSLAIPSGETTPGILRSFLLSYLPRASDGAGEILLPEPVADAAVLPQAGLPAVASRQGGMQAGLPGRSAFPTLAVPQRGWKRRLLELAHTNAEETLLRTAAELTSPASLASALHALASALHLRRPPRRIEAYDISNIQGALATASLVVFLDGRPARREYRRFKIHTVEGSDDVGMMREVLRRRFGHHVQRASVPASKRTRELTRSHARPLARSTEWSLPDLVILDGGKAQLGAGLAVLHELGLAIPTAALAKREEELFVPGNRPRTGASSVRGRQQAARKAPWAAGLYEVGRRDGSFRVVRLPPTSPALFLLQRVRDEAHRFTLGYHQLLRKRRMTRSILEEIPGVGDATRKKLLRRFGSLRGIRQASLEDLASAVGPKLAEIIQNILNR